MRRVLLVIALTLAGVGLVSSPASANVAPGCTADRPTFVGGTIVGYPDGRYLNAHIGVSVGDMQADGFHLTSPEGGAPDPSLAGYSFIDRINPSVDSTGTTETVAPDGTATTKVWGECVGPNVDTFYAEVYPKAPVDSTHDQNHQVTRKDRYGSSAYYSGTVTPGQQTNVLLRLPIIYQVDPTPPSSTGGVQGYITYQGQYVPSAYIKRVRAFPGSGATCGVEGYSASADQLTTAANPNRTYYKVDYLASGQCYAPYQGYALQITCVTVCGAPSKMLSKGIKIVKGTWPRVDVAFT